jgi:hypothetical protein
VIDHRGVEQDVGTHRCLAGQLSQTQPDFGGNWRRIGRRTAASMADWLVNGAGQGEGSADGDGEDDSAATTCRTTRVRRRPDRRLKCPGSVNSFDVRTGDDTLGGW